MSPTHRLLLERQAPPWSPGWAAVLAVYLAGLEQWPDPFQPRKPTPRLR